MKKEIDYIDVKLLYDAAFEEKAKARGSVRRFRQLLATAEKLDRAYRVQLASAPAMSYGRAA